MGKGFIYLCTRDGERHAVKGGFTTSECPEHYMQSNYSRTLHPLEILACQSVANASLAEKNMFHALSQYRIHSRHELFDLSTAPEGIVDIVMEVIRTLDHLSGMARPMDAPPSSAEYLQQLEIRAQSKAAAKQQKRVLQKTIQNTEKEELQIQRKRQREDRAEQHRLESLESRRQCVQNKVDYMNGQLTAFIRSHCASVTRGRTDTTKLREAFQTAHDMKISAVDFKKSMAERGFHISRQRLPCDGKAHQVFEGIEFRKADDAIFD